MNAQTASARRSGDTPALQPQLRTLLLTDLCDSTTLVERLGDAPAAALFRAHDQLVLELQQRWRGRLIDRSDGLLLLFERPIDGLGFALDYVRGLVRIGEEHRVTLKVRAGLHVGEVLTWRNSDAAVAVGAKPLEVEGLAKPMAGRLMTLARPGQLLLSAVAEPLARRAARELGERGEHLLWKSWGRWRFKGVPEAQEIYEVGEPGLAPLRAPKPTAKAWRDIPLWRRPAALAAEVLVLAGLATGAWFATRPQPAIAFGERDWVVVADLRNLTGDKVLDDSLEQAFRISLEQSRYVNVLSDLKARDTLALMQRKPDTVLDRTIASEIALRDGARAVILPTVAEVGGRVRVSAEVIDPHTQTTVYAESADGSGAASTLDSIDHVTAALRGKLGEALESIEKTSAPLPQVSTRNLDALRAYALGQKAYGKNLYADALSFYGKATELDPKFALAWIGQARSQFALYDTKAAEQSLGKALRLRQRLAPREAMYLEGWAAEIQQPGRALETWRLMSKLYPDFQPAQANVAIRLNLFNRFAEAAPYARTATSSKFDLIANALDLLGRAELGMEHYDRAARVFDQAIAAGGRDSVRRRADVAAARREFGTAEALLSRTDKSDPSPYLERISVAVDQADWQEGQAAVQQALRIAAADGQYNRAFLLESAVLRWLSGDVEGAKAAAGQAVDKARIALHDAAPADAPDDMALALSAAIVAERLGTRAPGDEALKMLDRRRDLAALPHIAELATVVRARQLLLAGDGTTALRLLEGLGNGPHRYQTEVARLDASKAAGKLDEARSTAQRLQALRGLAYIEFGCFQCLQALNVADSNLATLHEAELARSAGQSALGRSLLEKFDARWPPDRLPPYLRLRRDAVASSNNGGL
jgi:putative peptide modification system cyclase